MVEKGKNEKPRKPAKKHRGRGPGRPGIKDRINPVYEKRLEFIADLQVAFKTRKQILEACRAEGWKLRNRQIEEYIAEVRRRWKQENSLPDVLEKKAEAIKRLQRVYCMAEERISCTEKGIMHPNPDIWLMRSIILDITKFDGIMENQQSPYNELFEVLDVLHQERERARRVVSQ